MAAKTYIAIDQYGNTFCGLTHPRKQLCERLGRTHAEKIYRDTPNGTYHVGYIIGGLWLTLYEITPVLNPLN